MRDRKRVDLEGSGGTEELGEQREGERWSSYIAWEKNLFSMKGNEKKISKTEKNQPIFSKLSNINYFTV